MREVGYDGAFMFQYSERPATKAARKYPDNVPADIKARRLNEIIELQNELSLASNQKYVGNTYEVLVEGVSKKSEQELFGRTSQSKVCVFPAEGHQIGDYVMIKVNSCTPGTLKGEIINK